MHRRAVLPLLSMALWLTGCGRSSIPAPPPPPPPPDARAAITGTVSIPDFPPSAQLIVRLQDVSKPGELPLTVAEDSIPLTGKKSPVPFTLKYAPARMQATHTYSVAARVTDGNDLLFATHEPHLVLTRNRPTKVDIILRPPEEK